MADEDVIEYKNAHLALSAQLDAAFEVDESWISHTSDVPFMSARASDEDEEERRSGVSAISYHRSHDAPSTSSNENCHQQQAERVSRAQSEEDSARARQYLAHDASGYQLPSDAGSNLPLLELPSKTPKKMTTTVQEANYSPRLIRCTWLPFSLRWPILMALTVTALGLGFVAIVISTYSERHSGLSNNSSSVGFLFAWRFLPTLVAVLYALGITILTNDVKRTEPFAKMSMPTGSLALSSLVTSSGPWWKDPGRALSKNKNNGRRSWTLLSVSIANILAIVLVSPLSAGMLYVEEVRISKNTDFRRLELPIPLSSRNTTTDLTYFQTISSVLQNLTTSAWLSDSYTVLPFWPAEFLAVPFGASLAGNAQQWQAKTSVYQADLRCIPMDVTSKNYTNEDPYADDQLIKLASADGCTVELNVSVSSTFPPAGGWWSNTTSNTFPSIANSQGGPTINQTNTPECNNREMFFVTNPFHTNLTGETVATYGQLCVPNFYVAENITTTVVNTATTSMVTIDEEIFNGTKVALDPSIIDLSSFESQFLDAGWSAYFQPPGGFNEQRPIYGGPLILLAAMKGAATSIVDIEGEFNIAETLLQARILKQRFFGEALQAAFATLDYRSSQTIPSQVTITRNRLMVDYGIGIALGVILLFSSAMIILAFYCSRLRVRPLNLVRDPGCAAAAISMVLEDPRVRECFKGLDKLPEDSMRSLLSSITFRMIGGQLVVENNGSTPPFQAAGKTRERSIIDGQLRRLGLSEATRLDDDWRPAIIRRWTGITLLVFLTGLAVSIAALYVVSKRSGLQEAALVYQHTISLTSNTVVGLAPYSIVPTVFAVAVKLWWGALEETFKRLQPYVSMVTGPTKGSEGIGLSYINNPQVLASAKAFKKRHWLLAFVCFGAFWTEVFTIGMSALWQKNFESSSITRQIPTQLELRAIPEVFRVPENAEPEMTFQLPVLTQVFENPFESWLYGAVVEIVYNGASPAWSADVWSFVPSGQSTSFNGAAQGVFFNADVNVTTNTQAVRGRIECTPWELLSNTSTWLKSWDLTNSTFWNVSVNPRELESGYELLPTIDLSPNVTTTTFSNPSRLTCCANDTDDEPGMASIGYWSTNTAVDTSKDPADNVMHNFSIKWIVGNPISQQYVDRSNESHFIWQDVPGIAALNCEPIIESANSTVTVDLISGAVHNFTILDNPVVLTSPWSDNYEGHNSTASNPEDTYNNKQNVTVSYGIMFMDALSNAADIARLGEGSLEEIGYGDEDLTDKTFNFRLKGINSDYMSFSTYALAQQDLQRLLDPSSLQEFASSAFSTFFQHYASTNVSLTAGGRVFQTIGAELPFGLPPIINSSDGSLSSHQDSDVPSTSNRSVHAIVHSPVNELVMSLTAVILCLAILAFLACVTVVVYFPYAAYFKALPRDVETLASVIAFIYDSPKLRQWVAANENLLDAGTSRGSLFNKGKGERGKYRQTAMTESGGEANGLDDVTTGLGFFRGEQGIARFGVEIEPVVHAHPKTAHTALVANQTN